MPENDAPHICDLFAEAILSLRQDIATGMTRIEALRALLDAVAGRVTPDPVQIEALTAALRDAEHRLETDIAQHTGFSEEYSAAGCPPHPGI